MGYFGRKYGLKVLDITLPGTCPECGIAHDPEQSHNRDGMKYMYKFYDKHRRWPTWADAMAHCPEDVKRYWTQELKERGIPVTNSKEGGKQDE